VVSCGRKESGISDNSNLLESDECAENISDTIESGSSATDESSDTDFGEQEDDTFCWTLAITVVWVILLM